MDNAIVLALHGWTVENSTATCVVAFVAQYGIFVLPLVLAGSWLWPCPLRATRHEAIVAGAGAIVLAFLVSLALGLVIDRPRPFVALGLSPLFAYPADSSFPSDHTLLGVALVGPLAWRAPSTGSGLIA